MQVLEELAGAHPVARLLQERRTLAKVLADFVNTFAHRARRASFGSPGVVRVPFTSAPSQTILHIVTIACSTSVQPSLARPISAQSFCFLRHISVRVGACFGWKYLPCIPPECWLARAHITQIVPKLYSR